ncbi:hypothetical protein B0H14DRAFT_3115499 [Mycena olivaceomarginata]|nr:hypothetical protein B0H14DRAFT_3115499 [Mycena olivaceomarginata]
MEDVLSESGTNIYDLLVVTDATASMGGYLDALRSSIPEILALAKLSGIFSRLGVLAYKDYTDATDEIVAWSGWNSDNLPQFVQSLEPTGGGDFPEAAKTALIRGLQAVNKESKTLVLWYADAPPHHISVQSHGNDVSEAKAFPSGAVDWVKLCHTARRRNCTVFSFTPNSMDVAHSAFYVLLSELTGGISISTKAGSKSTSLISRLTLGVILQWLGQGAADMDDVLRESAASPLTAKPKPIDEALGCAGYLPPSHASAGTPLRQILSTPLDTSNIPSLTFSAHSFNLAKRFVDPSETDYRDLVYARLTEIIRSNVASLTYNPIFGTLWRAVCKDSSSRKTELVNLFSESVGKVTDADKSAALANSDGPMVYLDFDADVQLTRTQLLDVSRSCHAGVLKKIASVFTHLKLVEPGGAFAPHQRSLPLTLPPRDFFRLLPHLIVPGTLYPARAAGLTAIISLITGVPFLKDSATALLLATAKGKWLDMKVPENISFDCARLLLSAPDSNVVLTPPERRVYAAMRRYQLIELNLDVPLVVKVSWSPEKTRGPGDVKIQCRKCGVRRSITIMSHLHGDLCGLCISANLSPTKVASQFPDTDDGESCWVECSRRSCRAHYVVEDVAALKIRPRCHYCRHKKPCPWLECSVCANRIVVPPKFRTTKAYVCPACANPEWAGKRVMESETTARVLISQNGVGWLGFAQKNLFDGKSAFKLMQIFGETVFGDATADTAITLMLNNKKVHDVRSIVDQVEGRVGQGKVVLATCALCFEDVPSTKLVPACGRTGCAQLVDEGCLREWYGQNTPGKLLNAMQFACPFCRRRPTIKTLTRYNRDAATLGGLRDALVDHQFFYAWCIDCGFAKRAFERTVCTEEGIPPITAFRCKDCWVSAPVAPPESKNEFRAEHLRLQAEKAAAWKDVSGSKQARITKEGGCNHPVCVCWTHSCHVCGKDESALGDIYSHAYRMHGGAYDD